jgi:hypothetical protein
VRLKVAQDFGGGTLKIVAESATETIVPSSVNTYPSRISMPAGTDLGEFIGADCSREDVTYRDFFADGDLSVGTTSSLFTQEDFQQDISAVLEPDADHDGFGDETQDQCPTDGTTQGPCPAAPVTHKKKCKKHKKKHKSSAQIAKKCKKKKKG